jgi:error-prone DNA polymerase
MVIAQGRLDHVVPLEPATMPGRVVVQWDKEDCADLGIIKVDLLGLGMMSALQDSIHLLSAQGTLVDLAHLPPDDPRVYAMLQKADTVGLFQVESRAQMATLPRMKPDHFYDLVVEVAIIRPGPIVGKMVHPYLRRRNGQEEVTYAHPSLEPILKRTLGVPLFQEQLLRIAMTVAGFTGGEAEELRRAMGFKRSEKREAIWGNSARAWRAGITGGGGHDRPLDQPLPSTASRRSHRRPPSSPTRRLSQVPPPGPSPAPSSTTSRWATTVHAREGRARTGALPAGGRDAGGALHPRRGRCDRPRYVRGLRGEAAARIETEQALRPFASLQDFVDRTGLRRDEQRNLAEVGALNALGGLTRRSALWQVEKAGRPRGAVFRDVAPRDDKDDPSPLLDMTLPERLASDLAGTGLTVGPHPVSLFRGELLERGVLRAVDLARLADGERVRVAGAVICRQRPGTAAGFLFLTLEDETGLVNVIVRPDLFHRERAVLVGEAALEVDGVLQASDGLSVRAFTVRRALAGVPATPAREFH